MVDDWDADFYYLAEDESLMVRAIEHLLAAGFERLYRFVGNDGLVWQYSFLKDDAKFEFFRTVKSDATVLQYYDFVPSSAPVQQKKSFAGLPWSNLEFLDASWLAPKEIDRSLTSMYGDWRTPDPHWCWADDPLTISRETWEHSDTLHWTEGN
ncbi:hypothetical protein [Aeoliella sp.]|uniref:hypothetical protein n=1 Tax=Aeoliella sp. TaxID=2795800 RepID=UPI003CCB87BA